mgnify:CR=1 FL=1
MRKQIMLSKMQHTLNTIPHVKDSSFKHIIKSLKKHDIHLKGIVLQVGPQSELGKY